MIFLFHIEKFISVYPTFLVDMYAHLEVCSSSAHLIQLSSEATR